MIVRTGAITPGRGTTGVTARCADFSHSSWVAYGLTFNAFQRNQFSVVSMLLALPPGRGRASSICCQEIVRLLGAASRRPQSRAPNRNVAFGKTGAITPGSINSGLTTRRAVFSLASCVAYGPTTFQMFVSFSGHGVFALIPAADFADFSALTEVAQYSVEISYLV